jgi:hypothetical protein
MRQVLETESFTYCFKWRIKLPGLVSQSVLVDCFPCQLPSLNRRCQKEIKKRHADGKAQVVQDWQEKLKSGKAKNRAALARQLGLSRARVTQVLEARA